MLVSGLAIIICITMLIGTTFAWFTDSVTSSGNIIKSGTLDVEMYWANGTEALDSASWNDASTGAIFDYDLWEPGYTEVRHVKIENKGNLALKYQISIAANGTVSELADVIDVYYLDPAEQVNNRTALTADKKLGTLTEVLAAISTTASGDLEPGQNHTVTLALKMQESAGNEYQGKEIGADFSVILAATQKDFEEDSFGKDYDEGLTPPDEDGDILVEEDGIQYLYREDGTHWLYYVTPKYAEDTVVVPEGVTTIGGSSFAYNSNVKEVVFSSTVKTVRTNAFKGNTSVEKIVLNEGLTDLSTYERAFNQAAGLKEVVFPSTLKVIGKQAFAGTAMEELTIPATVETLYEGAFRDMPNLKTVTIEGNVNIGNFAFRACKNLETVYLLGDDVTFAGNSQVFTHADTGDAKGITVYVENETVAKRLLAAQPSASFTLKIAGENAALVSKAADFENAVKNNKYVYLLSNLSLTKTVPLTNANLILDGNGKTISQDKSCNNSIAMFDFTSGKVTIKNVTFKGIKNGALIRTVNTDLNMDNVTVVDSDHTVEQGLLRLLGESTITNSSFKNNKASMVLSFNFDGNDAETSKLVVDNCVFENNICSATAVVYYAEGGSATITNNTFAGNTVNSTSNAATLYLGFTENNVVKDNVFSNNNVTTTGTTKRAAGALMVGYDAVITGNAFVGNTITASNAKGNDVCASVYYTDIDLSGNYWGGAAPVENDDYFVEHKKEE